MKLTTVLIIAASLQVSARGFSQNLSFSGKNVPLQKVFSAIEKQSGYVFFYDYAIFEHAHPITLNISNVSLQVLLDAILKDQGMSYKIAEKTIFLIRNPSPVVPVAAPVSPTPPTTDIKGRVTNEKGEPLAGASIQVKGSRRGVMTDANGGFEIKAADGNITLIISYAGYAPKEIKARGKDFFEISLLASDNVLDAPVVIAYGTTTKRLNTGDVSTVTSKEIEQQPVSNPLAALEGRVPGLIVTQSSGVPGSSFKVEIRGRTSLDQSLSTNDPLFIIDGVPFAPGNAIINQLTSAANNPKSISQGGLSPFNGINPADIESIEVLKDADATAIYGSRGANGVILITTKKGKAGKTKFNVNLYAGNSAVSRTMDMLNTQQYLQMRKEAYKNDNVTPTISDAPDLLVWDTTRYTDWKKLLIGGTARTIDAQTSVSGGNANTQFLIGGGYHHETTVFPGNMADNRGSLHFSLNHSSENKKFTLSLSAYYSSDKNNLSVRDLSYFLNLPPDFPSLYDATGKLNFSQGGSSFASLGFENPLTYLFKQYTAKNENLTNNLLLNYCILPNLKIKTSFGYNTLYTSETAISPKTAIDPATSTTAASQFGNGNIKSWIIEPQIEYTKKTVAGQFNILIGSTWQEIDKNYSKILASGYTSDLLLMSAGAASSATVSNSYSQYNYNAVFGRLNYNWQDKYIINASARRDGSSRFGPDKRFANFGAVGAAWIFSNEKFGRAFQILSYGKLRSSYGVTGNDQIQDYLYLDTWTSTSLPYQATSGLRPTRLYNPDYNWERNRKLEIAIELGFFKDKILLSTSYFQNRSNNLLIKYPLPIQAGFTSIQRNFDALVQNTGIEISLATKNIVSSHFSWISTFNLTIPNNKLISFPTLSTTSYANTYVIGQSLNTIKYLQFLGVDPATGVYHYNDVNKDGVLDSKDYLVSGNRDPKFYGGFQNSFTSRGWKLDLFFEYRKQTGNNYLSTQNDLLPGFFANQPVIVLNRWQKAGDITDVQQFTQTFGAAGIAGANYLPVSNGKYSDASYIRLKNISLSYNLLEHWFKKINFQNCSVYLQAQNLFTITRYKGSDPETQSLYILPPLRTITAGIQLNF